jgi:3-oxoacyl-[acyl-carrier protein] reductase
MFDLTGQKALVTGATGGIGGATARSLAAQGAHVVISGTNEGKLASLAEQLTGQVTILPCQLNDLTQAADLFDQAEAAAGDISIVVNNAGITRDMLAIRMKDEDWDEVVSLTFHLWLAQLETQGRRIIAQPRRVLWECPNLWL